MNCTCGHDVDCHRSGGWTFPCEICDCTDFDDPQTILDWLTEVGRAEGDENG